MDRAPEGCTGHDTEGGTGKNRWGRTPTVDGGVGSEPRDGHGEEERRSPGDQWTQPRGALHSLGYYVVSPPLRSNTMPAATYYARRYYTGRPTGPPRTPDPPFPSLFPSSVRHSPTAHFPLSRPHAVPRNFVLSCSLSLHLYLSTFFVRAQPRVPTASRANFDPPIATRRRLPRAGKLISPRIHAPSRALVPLHP